MRASNTERLIITVEQFIDINWVHDESRKRKEMMYSNCRVEAPFLVTNRSISGNINPMYKN